MTNEVKAINFAHILNENIDVILPKITHSYIEKYDYLMVSYLKFDINEEDKYKRTFRSYYIMRYPTQKYADEFFQVMDMQKNTDKPKLREVSESLFFISNRHELSFITKMLHTRFDNFPIYDKHVCNFFGFKHPTGSLEDKIKQSEIIVQNMINT